MYELGDGGWIKNKTGINRKLASNKKLLKKELYYLMFLIKHSKSYALRQLR